MKVIAIQLEYLKRPYIFKKNKYDLLKLNLIKLRDIQMRITETKATLIVPIVKF